MHVIRRIHACVYRQALPSAEGPLLHMNTLLLLPLLLLLQGTDTIYGKKTARKSVSAKFKSDLAGLMENINRHKHTQREKDRQTDRVCARACVSARRGGVHTHTHTHTRTCTYTQVAPALRSMHKPEQTEAGSPL
jgi:hypothetical protein